jgi:integrase/recombinase XerD
MASRFLITRSRVRLIDCCGRQVLDQRQVVAIRDLRHTFAVRALQASPVGRTRSGKHMVALATYMGHVNIYATYWYLEATADLMRDVPPLGKPSCVGARNHDADCAPYRSLPP